MEARTASINKNVDIMSLSNYRKHGFCESSVFTCHRISELSLWITRHRV